MYKHKRYKMCVRSRLRFVYVSAYVSLRTFQNQALFCVICTKYIISYCSSDIKNTHKFTNVYKQNINTSQSSPKSRKCVTCVSHMFHICFTYVSHTAHICFHLRCTYTSHTHHIRSTNVNVYVSFDFCIRGHLGYVCVPPRQLL